jgi:hypothetical protein
MAKVFYSVRQKLSGRRDRNMADMHGIANLKGSMKGKRCFIIGNGPSLSLSDLNCLQNEDCFATNTIYQLFDKTPWRPKYYVSIDANILGSMVSSNFSVIADNCEYVFLRSSIRDRISSIEVPDNVRFIFGREFFFNPGRSMKFSDDVEKIVYVCGTVTYVCIQIAVYLGYSEIYLLGVDHNFGYQAINGSIVKTDGQNHMKELDYSSHVIGDLDRMNTSYEKAAEECAKRGVTIKNATRGGKLEIFPRVDFDSLINPSDYE